MSNFSIGQNVFIQSGQYRGDSVPIYTPAKVVKVLKTRVVVEYTTTVFGRSNGETTRTPATVTKRFVLKTYGAQNHLQEEGYVGDYYHNVALVLDDAELANRRASHVRQQERDTVVRTAVASVRPVLNSRWGGSDEELDAAIEALTALKAQRAADKAARGE